MSDAGDDDEIAPNATVYVKNLEERVKIPALIEALRGAFAEYGTIIDIIAKKNLKAKGQAFVVFDSIDSAQNAIDEVNGFELFGKQLSCEFAKTQSDATVARTAPAELEEHKKTRLADKERKKTEAAAAEAAEQAKKRARDDHEEPTEPVERVTKLARGTGLKPATSVAAGLVPDEYLPPNKILFVRQVPVDYDLDQISDMFRFPGFREARLVPTRKGIAFVEFDNEQAAIRAKEERDGKPFGDVTLKVTYQRQ